jgi:hypothetical protein
MLMCEILIISNQGLERKKNRFDTKQNVFDTKQFAFEAKQIFYRTKLYSRKQKSTFDASETGFSIAEKTTDRVL